MNFLFQAAFDVANLAKRVALGFQGKLPVAEGDKNEGYLIIDVRVGYRPFKDGLQDHSVESIRVNQLVAEYFKANIDDALNYAVTVLERGAETALVGSKAQLQEHLARIEALEAAQKDAK